MKLAVLMFHALYSDQHEHAALRAEERPYAMATEEFEHLLKRLAALQPQWVTRPEQIDPDSADLAIMLTFDDGHVSATKQAQPILSRHGLPAVFFVTTDFISARDDYCNSEQLRALAETGMSIQSHGHTHQFLNTLNEQAARDELVTSKQRLEEITAQTVDAISFPGGRFGKREIDLGKRLGYSAFYTSRFGRNSATSAHDQYRRIAYRAGMPVDLLVDLVNGRPGPTYQHHLINTAKRSLRHILGEAGYQKAYERLKAR